MIDLHCHLLPYVDDGAQDLDEAKALLDREAEQGVTAICVTPHLRKGMFETPDAVIIRQYERLRPIAEEKGIRLFLSREYHYDSLFREKLRERSVLPLGDDVLLTEFSYEHSAEQILSAIDEVRSFGYTPLIAHAERYAAMSEELVREARDAGARIQVNADAVLGRDGLRMKRFVSRLLKAGLVDAIASDAHSTDERPPRLKPCRDAIVRRYGEGTAERLLDRKPEALLRKKCEKA